MEWCYCQRQGPGSEGWREDSNGVWAIGGPSPRRSWLATARPPSASGGRTVEPPGCTRGGARGRCRHSPRFGLSASRPDLPGSFLGPRPETTLRFWARVLFVLWLWVLLFSHLRRIPWCAFDNEKGLRRFGAPASAAGALRGGTAACLHRPAAGGLTAAAVGKLFIATVPGALCCHAVAVAGTTPAAAPRPAA